MSRIVASALLLAASVVHAGNVDLSTVPGRQSVQLTIYNSEDITLVRERRALSFKQGGNPLQFTWANTLIDPTSVELSFPGSADQLEVLDTTFPHDRPQLLLWNVDASEDVEATVEISYFTSGITWSADYVAIANDVESAMSLTSFVRVTNNSGEDYENAEVRLVVGTINLVQRIAELAQLPVGQLDRLDEDSRDGLRQRVLRRAMAAAPAAEVADAQQAPKAIRKQGLSDYFIYTIEGTETITNGWAKRLRSFAAERVPLEVQYRYRPRQYGDALVRLYLLANDEQSGLGTTPLPDGEVRVFRGNGRNGLSFLAAERIQYVPIGDKIELNLGADPEVLFELVKLRTLRDNIWLKIRGGSVYQQADEPGIRIESNSEVAGWDEHAIYTQRIRNFSGRSIQVEVRREYAGDVVYASQLEPRLHDYRTVQLDTAVAPGEQRDLLHEVITRNGYNRKQDRVELVRRPVSR